MLRPAHGVTRVRWCASSIPHFLSLCLSSCTPRSCECLHEYSDSYNSLCAARHSGISHMHHYTSHLLWHGFALKCIGTIALEYVQHLYADNTTHNTTCEQIYPDVDVLTYTSASREIPLGTSCSKWLAGPACSGDLQHQIDNRDMQSQMICPLTLCVQGHSWQSPSQRRRMQGSPRTALRCSGSGRVSNCMAPFDVRHLQCS